MNMTREILNKVAKENKVNLDWYDHCIAYINENYTKIYITFGLLEVVGGYRNFCSRRTIVKSVAAIQRRNAQVNHTEPSEWEYATQGWEEISTIR